MSRINSILLEYNQLIINARKTLDRVPDEKYSWKPHKKSLSMGDLATHLANIQTWINITLEMDEFDMNPKDGEGFIPPKTENRKELIEMFEKNYEIGKKCLEETMDEKLDGNWSLLNAGETLFTMPKIVVIRNFILNHMIHHTAQLGVYLRLNDIAVPAIFGPSADEEGM